MSSAPRKMILICSNVFPPTVIGGAELVAYYHARELWARGHQVAVFCGDTSGQWERHSMRRESFQEMSVFRIALEPTDFSSENVNFFHSAVEQHFEAILDELKPDVVHLHNIIGLSAGLLGRSHRRGIRTVLTVHDHWGFCYKNTILKTGQNVCSDFSRCSECMPYIEDGADRHIPIRLRRDFLAMQLVEADAIISPSAYLAGAYIRAGVPSSRVKIISYGTDVERFSRVAKTARSGSPRFTFVGYLGYHKGVDLVVEAAKLIRDFNPSIQIVGTGDLGETLRSRVAENCLESIVHFRGKVDHNCIETILRETDVLVLPSVWPENQPLTILEAMATRTAVIASHLGGIPELIEDGVNGLLFRAGDAHHLASQMLKLIKSPERIQEFGEAGYRKIQDVTYSKQIDEILALYSRLTPESVPSAVPLIACAGRRFSPQTAEAIEGPCPAPNRHFVMAEWLNDIQLQQAALLWIFGDDVSWQLIYRFQAHGVPLLVPEENAGLREYCRRHQCGLYYGRASEAQACIDYLLSAPAVRSALGRNSSKATQQSSRAHSAS
jgi:glycosyltransferase involved in cell wall biosynthesis